MIYGGVKIAAIMTMDLSALISTATGDTNGDTMM
jgi:hypothetical protein